MTAEELADEEWGPVKGKKDKGKKGKKKGGAKAAEEEEEEPAAPAAAREYFSTLVMSISNESSGSS
jgi:translation initiation factor 5B